MDSNHDTAFKVPGDGNGQISNGELDMRAFFRDVEKVSRSFLAFWDKRAPDSPAFYPYRMTREEWWREFLKYSGKNAGR